MNDEQNFAGFGRRLCAALIDLLILILISVSIGAYSGFSEGFRMFKQMILGQVVLTSSGTVVHSLVPIPVLTAFVVTFILIPWIYFAVLESSRNQATLGRWLSEL